MERIKAKEQKKIPDRKTNKRSDKRPDQAADHGEKKRQRHEFGPVFDKDCSILILGSFPSVRSREEGFYYGHPQNRFWKVLAAVLSEPVPATVDEKKKMVLKHHVALWDVLESCRITGSSDSSIGEEIPVDIAAVTGQCRIRKIFTNGSTAKRMYDRYLYPVTEKDAVCLPSTSPANASWSVERLKKKWEEAINGTDTLQRET